MYKQIIIFGNTGMLGSYIYKYLLSKHKKVIGLNRNDIDILQSNIHDLEKLLLNYKINENTLIINCIGLIPQVKPLNDYDYIMINSVFPNNLNQLSIKYKFKLIHPTTDCVFNGKKGKYTENCIKDEYKVYGISKILGENVSNAMIIRTSIIGHQKTQNYSLLQWLISNKNQKVNGFTNCFWNGITCLQFAKIIDYIIDNKIYWYGVKHIFSNETVSKYELLSLINKIYDLNIEITPMKSNYEIIDKSLDTIYTNNLQGLIPPLDQQIIEMKQFEF